MLIIIWEYQLRADHAAEFEGIYSANGAWAQLFRNSPGFLCTQLLRDEKRHQRYLTIDRWASPEDYESFLSQWKNEYEALDAECESLTEQEALLGRWESIPRETR